MLTRTETTEANQFGHTTWTLVEMAPSGAWLRTQREIVEQFEDGVQIVRHSATSFGFPPKSGTDSDVRLRIDPERQDLPQVWQPHEQSALLRAHIADLIAASDRFGYCGRGGRAAFLDQSNGHGCLPVQAAVAA